MRDFVHLHNHTEFSLLDGAAKIENITQKACDCGMSSIAISDHGNMYGVPKFALTAERKGLKAIIGCEFYITAQPAITKTRENKNYHQILLAKNAEGYHNLIKLCSFGYTDGFYYKPRIDKDMLKEYSSGLIASSCCLASEINRAIIDKGEEEAEKILKWYLDVFGDDYYLELQRHGLGDMDRCNEVLLRWSKKHNIKVIATNDVHYVNKEDSEAHDLLLALQTNSDYNDPNRFRFTDDNNKLNPEFYLKSTEEMAELFHDVPEALENTLEIADKVEPVKLKSSLILPQYKVPEGFKDMDDYLAHITWAGSKKKYNEITTEISERIVHELSIIKKMGFAGYFLIVQSFTTEARRRGVYVGPGRGSAAGSVVAYCLGIIDVDPIEYSLLFERFLNPERVSPPDIDIDFDDEGRQEVIDYVIEEYGRESVSQIITYGTMGAKTALRDVGRVLGVPLAEVNRITKLIPEKPGMTFSKALDKNHNPDYCVELQKSISSKDDLISKMMKYAQTLEGTARHTGVHACAVIIAPGKVSNYVPVAISRDKTIVTQYDGPSSEECGLLKMDFLGLKTLSIIKTAIRLVKKNHDVIIDPENIEITDEKTFKLYQAGETVATFQFESDGMRKYLKQLKPTCLEDLIAMNALYRPGPMDNIPLFIDRKHGRVPTEYAHEKLEPILKNTNGIMVYQEQIMQAAQVMANYSLGQADLLRRAMGKKKADVMEKERVNFINGASEQGVDVKKAEEIFSTMEKFAAYGFNKSHAAAYSLLAYKTAYLKANYPHEYMAAVLTHNLNDISKITFFIEECRRMKINVLPPDLNESDTIFNINDKQELRFGLEGIKGVGKGISADIVKERTQNGPFTNLFDLTSRVPTGGLNKKVLESLTYAGALDSFNVPYRSNYFIKTDRSVNSLERAISYGNKIQQEKASRQVSLFGGSDSGDGGFSREPEIPQGEEWPLMLRLNYEKDVIGFYLSGHPLDDFKIQIKSFTTCGISELENYHEREVKIAGIVVKNRQGMTKRGTPYATFRIEDFSGGLDLALFNDDYAKFGGYTEVNSLVFVRGSFQKSWRDPNVFEFKITEMKFLEETLEKMTKLLLLKFPLRYINDKFIDRLDGIFSKNQGKCRVEFMVIDDTTPVSVELQSRTSTIKVSNEMIEELETLNVAYTLK